MLLEILHKQELTQTPSASGIEKHGQFYYVMGDNVPWLYKLDTTYTITDKIAIAPVDSLVNDVIPKKVKPDFEAMTMVDHNGQRTLLVFGSGSKSPRRDGLVKIDVDHGDAVTHFSLTDLYHQIRTLCNLEKGELNIEAAAANETQLYLFNRGKNRIFVFELSQFMAYIHHKGPLPTFKTCKVKLPEIEGLKAGLSGADISADGKSIIFTASVENTSNSYDDGAILGSFVGVIPIDQLQESIKPECILLKQENRALKIKVESVAVTQQSANGSLSLVLVTDSDGQASELLEVKLSI